MKARTIQEIIAEMPLDQQKRIYAKAKRLIREETLRQNRNLGKKAPLPVTGKS